MVENPEKGLNDIAGNFPCEKKSQFESKIQELETLVENLRAEKTQFTFTMVLIGSESGRCCPANMFSVKERATGGAGVTKWIEIIIHCPQLNVAFFQDKPSVDLASGLVPEVLAGCLAVKNTTSTIVRILRSQGVTTDLRARVAWDEVGEYDVLEPIEQPLRPNFQYPVGKSMGSFASYLKKFPEDSVENLIGRIWLEMETAARMLRSQFRNKDEPLNSVVASILVEIGRLEERLLWKYRHEKNTAIGKKFDSRKNVRTKKAIAANRLDRQKRASAIFRTIEILGPENFTKRSSGTLNAAALSRAVVAQNPFEGTKTGMSPAAVAHFIRDNSDEVNSILEAKLKKIL